MSDEFITVGRIDDFPEGNLRKVKVAGEDVVVANVGGRIYAISDCCTHRGAPLAEGNSKGPWLSVLGMGDNLTSLREGS